MPGGGSTGLASGEAEPRRRQRGDRQMSKWHLCPLPWLPSHFPNHLRYSQGHRVRRWPSSLKFPRIFLAASLGKLRMTHRHADKGSRMGRSQVQGAAGRHTALPAPRSPPGAPMGAPVPSTLRTAAAQHRPWVPSGV